MHAYEIYAAFRQHVFVEGKSRKDPARLCGLRRNTMAQMCRYSGRRAMCRRSCQKSLGLARYGSPRDSLLRALRPDPPPIADIRRLTPVGYFAGRIGRADIRAWLYRSGLSLKWYRRCSCRSRFHPLLREPR
jgi:hypothetical protein